MREPLELPHSHQHLLETIYSRAGSRHGCFDVFAWRGRSRVLFAEAKRAGRDRIRPTQIRWLDAAIASGVQLSSLLVVEWRLADRAKCP